MSNVITVMGNVGRDAEVRQMDNGDVVANFSVADNGYNREDDDPMWFNVSYWGEERAEWAEEHVVVGAKVVVTGRFNSREYEYENDDGDYEDRTSLDINATYVDMAVWANDDDDEEDDEEDRPRRRSGGKRRRRSGGSKSRSRSGNSRSRGGRSRRRDDDDDYEDEDEDERPRRRRYGNSRKSSKDSRSGNSRSRRGRSRRRDDEEEEDLEDLPW